MTRHSMPFVTDDGFTDAHDAILDQLNPGETDENIVLQKRNSYHRNDDDSWKSSYLGQPFPRTYDGKYEAFLKHVSGVVLNEFRFIITD